MCFRSQAVALASCFVFNEKTDVSESSLPDELQGPLRVLQETARRVAKVKADAKITIDEEECALPRPARDHYGCTRS